MREYVNESEESLNDKRERVDIIITEESLKLYAKKKIKYEFDNYSGEVKLVFVKQTVFDGGRLSHDLLMPLRKRIKEVDNKWHVGIMSYGGIK